MFEFEGMQYIERDSVKAEALENYRARVALGESIHDAIQAAYSDGIEKDKELDKLEAVLGA